MKDILIWFIILLFCFIQQAQAQNNHDQGHNDYSHWSSRKTGNCCNRQDCGDLADDEWRETATGTEVKIKQKWWNNDGRVETGEDVWCPVEVEHLAITGHSPDASRAHMCVRQPTVGTTKAGTCERLLCFMGPSKS